MVNSIPIGRVVHMSRLNNQNNYSPSYIRAMQNLKAFSFLKSLVAVLMLLSCFGVFVGYFFIQRTYLNRFKDFTSSVIDFEQYLVDYTGLTWNMVLRGLIIILIITATYYLITLILNNWLRKRIRNGKDVKLLCLLLTLWSLVPAIILIAVTMTYGQYFGSAQLLVIAAINLLCGLYYFFKIFKPKY